MKEVLRDTFEKQGQEMTFVTFDFLTLKSPEIRTKKRAKRRAGLSREKMMREYETSKHQNFPYELSVLDLLL